MLGGIFCKLLVWGGITRLVVGPRLSFHFLKFDDHVFEEANFALKRFIGYLWHLGASFFLELEDLQILELGLLLELVKLGVVLLEQVQELLVVILCKLDVLVSVIQRIFHQLDLCLLVGGLEIDFDREVVEVGLYLHQLPLGLLEHPLLVRGLSHRLDQQLLELLYLFGHVLNLSVCPSLFTPLAFLYTPFPALLVSLESRDHLLQLHQLLDQALILVPQCIQLLLAILK